MKKLSAIGFMVILLAQLGCAAYRIDRAADNNLPPKLDRAGSAYISVSEDGIYNSEIYLGSGMATVEIIMNEFSKYLSAVSKGTTPETYGQALRSALQGGHKYLIFPSIEQWEDHKTEITEMPDRIKLKIMVVETLSEDQIDSVIISGKSRLFTTGGDEPQDLLATPIRIYVDSMFE